MEGIRLRPARPLLPAHARPWAGALLACCAVLVAVLGLLFSHQSTADWLDRAVDAPVVSWLGPHHSLDEWLATPGTLIPVGVLSAAVVVVCLLAGRLNGALLAAAAVPVAVELDERLIKPIVHRISLGALSYPSGHTTAIIALAATVTVLLLYPPQSARAGPLRVLILAVAWLLGAAVAAGVIALRWHYFTDTMAGAAVGIGTVCGLALILDLPAVRRLLAWPGRQPVVPQGRL
jgi:membrane-associated phospholipid phosphatase